MKGAANPIMDAGEIPGMADPNGPPQFELEEIDHVILDLLQEGARTQAYMVDESESEFQRHHFRERLKILTAVGYIRKVHEQTALYELVYDPREDLDDSSSDSDSVSESDSVDKTESGGD